MMRFKPFDLLEALPLVVFVIFYKIGEPITPRDWLIPYLSGALLAIFVTFVLITRGVALNSVLIGINIYLLTGCLALLTRQGWLIQLYASLEASGMLAWVIVVGVFSLLFSPSGFIDVESENRKVVVAYSVGLLLIAVVAFLLAYLFRPNRMFTETVPFVILFAAYGAFRSRANTEGSIARD